MDAHYSISMKRQLKYALGFSNSILDAWVKMYKPSMSCMKNNIHFLMYKQRPVKETNILPCLYHEFLNVWPGKFWRTTWCVQVARLSFNVSLNIEASTKTNVKKLLWGVKTIITACCYFLNSSFSFWQVLLYRRKYQRMTKKM